MATDRTTRRDLIRAGWLLGAGAAFGGLALGPVLHGGGPAGAAQGDADPTRTREAELEELSDLRTQAAEPKVCTPAPTDTPAPTETPVPATATATVVPPVAAGQPVPYGGTFLITVLGVAPVPGGGELQPVGQFLRVNLTIANQTNGAASPPFTDWVLTDATGQSYEVDLQASSKIVGVGWALKLGAGETADRGVVFDVPADAGGPFTLESRADPTFRIALAIESRG